MRLLKQSSTAQALTFLLVDATDHVTPKTGLSPTVTIRKEGGSFASPAGVVSEIGDGWYQVAGNATDTATLGSLILHATGTGADPTDREYLVVAFDPLSASSLGLTNLDATVTSRLAAGSYAAAPSAGTVASAVRTELETELGRIDAAISSRMATFSYTAPPSAGDITAAVWANEARTLTTLGGLAPADSSGVTTLLTRIGSTLTITAGKVTVGALPDPAPAGYGFDGEISGLSEGQDEKLSAIFARTSGGAVVFVSPLTSSGEVLRLIQGDDYFASEGRSLDFASEDWPVLTGGTVKLKIGDAEIDGTITAARAVRFEPTSEQTEALPEKPAKFFEVEATLENGHVLTLVRGRAIITADL